MSLFDTSPPMEETQERKRKRIARACQMCQKKKIRCDGKQPACTFCVTHEAECIFTQPPKTRGTRRNAKYIEGLEERLRKMETLFTRSVVASGGRTGDVPSAEEALSMLDPRLAKNPGDPGDTVIVQDPGMSPPDSNRADETFDDSLTYDEARMDHQEESPSHNSEITRMTDRERERDDDPYSPNSEMNSREHLDFYRIPPSKPPPPPDTRSSMSAAGFSIFSPKGIQWVIEKTGNTTFKDTMYKAALEDHKLDYWKTGAFKEVFTRPIFIQLPPKEEATAIVMQFFRDFNGPCPIVSEPIFMRMLDRQYSANPPDNTGWWACLNSILSIEYAIQAVHNKDEAPDFNLNKRAWDYFKNAMVVLTELILRSSDLWAVQALIAMALFMQGTADPRPTAFLIASAMRLAHTLGLHQTDPTLDPIEAEQRKRVFWMAYRIDKDICIRSRLPLIQDDDDISIDLPSENPGDGCGFMTLSDGTKFNIFRAMVEFSKIEAAVHKNLYSPKAMTQSDEELLVTIGDLDRQLEEWKENLPVDFHPEYEIKIEETGLRLHIIVAQFAYYNCLNMIHRTSVTHSYWTNRSSALEIFQPLNPRVFSSASLCSSAARASIRLTRYIPTTDISFVWRVLYFPVSALIILFANIIETPTDPRTKSDLRLMASFVEFLSKLEEPTGEIKRIWRVCSEFEKMAKDLVEKTKQETESRKGMGAKRPSFNGQSGSRQSNYQPDQPMTPDSGGMRFGSTHSYSNTAAQIISPSLAGFGLEPNQFGQDFSALIGQPVDSYPEIQPEFPNGLTMPWNGFQDSFGANVSGTRVPFDFSAM